MPEKKTEISPYNSKHPIRARVTLKDLFPAGFNLQITGTQARQEQQTLIQDRITTPSQAAERLRQARTNKNFVESMLSEDSLDRMLALSASSAQILTQYQTDPLEQYRIDRGLATKREQLFNQLRQELEPKKGLELFNHATGKHYQNIRELNRDYPHVTQTELALFSLVENVPQAYVESGKPRTDDKTLIIDHNEFLVPTIIGASVEGLLCTQYSDDPNVVSPDDGYGNLGVTSAPGPIETAPFTKPVAKIVNELVALSMSNYRMHERLINSSSTVIVDGFSQIDKVALKQVLGNQFKTGVTLPEQLGGLTPEQRKEFDKAKTQIDNLIVQALVVDLNSGIATRAEDMVKLIGVLDYIPNFLLDDQEIFRGFFIPYGPGVLFLDDEGQSLQFVPYNTYYLRNALQGLYYERVDVSKSNNTMAFLFNDLSKQAESISASNYDQEIDELSALEGIKTDMKLVFNIDLDISPRMDIHCVQDEADARNSMGAATMIEPRLKIGLEEAKQIYQTLRLLPKELLNGVKTIRKRSKRMSTLEDLMTGAEVQATFTKRGGILTFLEDPMITYTSFSPELRVVRSFVLTHEVAHSIWNFITPELKQAWRGISWNNPEKREQSELNGFLTLYSHVENPTEDFCDHFASYVLHADEFRTKTQDNAILRSKYNFIKQYLNKLLGKEVEFPQISPFEIEKLHGAIDRQLQKYTEKEAAAIIEANEIKNEITRRQAIENVSNSTDRGQAVDVIRPDTGNNDRASDESSGQDLIDFERESVNDIFDFLSEEGDEKEELRNAQRIYSLLSDDDLEKAELFVKTIVGDEDKQEEMIEVLRQIHRDLDEGNIGVKRRQLII